MGDTAEDFRSEVVLGFVGPVGVEKGRFYDAATMRLKAFGYEPHIVRLSVLLDELRSEGLLHTELKSSPEYDRVRSHMDAGDELRGKSTKGSHGFLAAAAIAKIGGHRQRNASKQTIPLPGTAWIVSSLKHPAEVDVFRQVYGSGFFLVGLFGTEFHRRRALERGMAAEEAADLIDRDAASDARHGQHTRQTFELADAWVQDADGLCRLLDLIFGNPFLSPTDDEDAMALAYTSVHVSPSFFRFVPPSGCCDRLCHGRGNRNRAE